MNKLGNIELLEVVLFVLLLGVEELERLSHSRMEIENKINSYLTKLERAKRTPQDSSLFKLKNGIRKPSSFSIP